MIIKGFLHISESFPLSSSRNNEFGVVNLFNILKYIINLQ